ncbi:lysozyme inhibitor LprI family protein [Paraburkholderia bryophila]|uniref:Uncharacterized protein YecT (DUF1311 family) n=1 Tax=Paraburkholderia bryophila TaxID=420952 RepID=A0A7Y9WEJ7_9BURK|nr:lysozyme inhibitor LprI family protein [Paraburkholderia bryophila]NYH19377.1 uncharacterized protein YecT (DUF1311 family) [Paraburkholderia bryophila]
MKLNRYLVLALSCVSLNAFALDCNNPPGGTDLASAQGNFQCAEKARVAADKLLNDTYKKLLGSLNDNSEKENSSRTQIVSAQRAWIAFRNAECEFRTSLNGGAHQWLVVNRSQCIAELTADRTKVLQSYLEQAQAQ